MRVTVKIAFAHFCETAKDYKREESQYEEISILHRSKVTFGILSSDGEGVLRSRALHAVCLDGDDP